MAGLGIQDAVNNATVKIAGAATAAKSVNEQKKSREEQEKSREQQERRNKAAEDIQLKEDILNYTKADMDLHQNEADIAKEMRQQPGKSGFKFFHTEDINKFLERKYIDADNKYTSATAKRDWAMRDPRYIDKRTKAGRAFSKAEKEMNMYYNAEREALQQVQLHDMLFKKKEIYKQQLINKKLIPEEHEVWKRDV